MKGEGRMSMKLTTFGTVVAAVVMYWWLGNAVLSSLAAVGVIDGRVYVPVMSDSGQVSVSLPIAKDNGSDGPLRDNEKPEIQLEPDSGYHDRGLLDKLNADSALSNIEIISIPVQEKWKWRDSKLPQYLKPHDFTPPEFPGFQIPKWIPEPAPPMVLPQLGPGDYNWRDKHQSINRIMPKMPVVRDVNRALAQQIGQ